MKKAVIFDMYETLVTLYSGEIYFGTQMAKDSGIPNEDFQQIWQASKDERSTGRLSFEDILEYILKTHGCYSEQLMSFLVKKRLEFGQNAFQNMHREIIPLLNELKKRQIKIGLISNCFSEEATLIKQSSLFPYFDAVCLSYDEQIQKPNLEIFRRCIEKLDVYSQECIYVGDGGCDELKAATIMKMQVFQAAWYIGNHPLNLAEKKPEYSQLEKPLELLNHL